jgi:AraC-like DNA-binding protein
VDPLSELLKVVEVKGALFYNAEYSAPWCFRSPPSRTLAAHLNAEAGHLILYHFVTEGSAWAQIDGGERMYLVPGDIVIFPHGDPHMMGNGATSQPVDHEKELERILSHGLQVTRAGCGGEVTKFVCGYIACDIQISRILLGALPPLLKINTRESASGRWIENSIQLSVEHATSSIPGAEAVLAKLSETLFVETLRQYITSLPQNETGWLAGIRDAEIGKALALLHRESAHPWTLTELAKTIGVSRTVLAERFRHYIGQPPMGYLTRWRLQLAARLLRTDSSSVGEVAVKVGYDSQAAFNRAFKRQFGVPPARYRKASREGPAALATDARTGS